MKPAALPVAYVVLACVQAAAAWAAPSAPGAALAAPDAAQTWPRLFYSTGQRQSIEQARIAPAPEGANNAASAPVAPAIEPRFVLQGMAQGRRGASAWINGEMLEQGQTIAGRTVRIEPQGVRLRQAGQPDIVLRPGQQGSATDPEVQDIVPSDSFHKK